MPRITLTKKELASDAGRDLLERLKDITADGEVTDTEIEQLRAWLTTLPGAEVPAAVHWMRELVEAIVADGKATRAERNDLLVAIERVLPMEDRIIAKVRRRDAAEKRREEEAASRASEDNQHDSRRWEDDPATERQLAFMSQLGIKVEEADLTKGQASDLITAKLDTRDVSNRQMMVLRFWDQVKLVGLGRLEVSEWIDEWYSQDHRHLAAWEQWKRDHDDSGGQGDPSVVPIGAGFGYLKRLAKSAGEHSEEEDNLLGTLLLALVIIAAGVGLAAAFS